MRSGVACGFAARLQGGVLLGGALAQAFGSQVQCVEWDGKETALDDATLHQVVALLDEAAQKIERLR